MDRPARDLREVAGRGIGPDELGEAISRAVGSLVPYDALRVVGTNPAAGLGLASFSCWHQYEPALINELVLDRFLGGDPCRPEDLDRMPVPVGVVGAEVRGEGHDVARARRTRRVLEAHGVGCELRSLLRDRAGVWGFVGLVRAAGRRPFDETDIAKMAELGPAVAAALRTYAKTVPLVSGTRAPAAGVITIGPDHRIRGISAEASAWLEQVWMPGSHDSGWLFEPFAAELSLRTRHHGHVRRPLICPSATSQGRWVAVHGQALDEDGEGDVAIVIQAAGGRLLLPSFCHWHGITARERRVIDQLCDGAAPKLIARVLDLSVHTVNDHLKAVYRKTGAGGRDELVAALTV